MGAVAMRDVLSDVSLFESQIEQTLANSLGDHTSSQEIQEASVRVVAHAKTVFGDRVSEAIGHRVRKKLRGIEAAPEMINDSPTTRRTFLESLAERTGGDAGEVRTALSKLNVHGDRADRIVRAVRHACDEGQIDKLGNPEHAGPDVITGWSDGLYANAADDLQAGLDETLSSVDHLRSQLGHRDMATPESANLVNPNVSATRSDVLDQLGIGDITDGEEPSRGGDAEQVLREYRTDLMTDNTWTEQLASLVDTASFGVADYFTGGMASGGAAGMELFVAWHEANMADFAERRLGTADAGTGAQAWRELGERATGEAVEVMVGQLVDGLPTPNQAPAHVDMVLEGAKQQAASRIGAASGGVVGEGVSSMAGETNVTP
jgi:hypothetical protein